MAQPCNYSLRSSFAPHVMDVTSVIPLNEYDDDSIVTASADGSMRIWARDVDGAYKECRASYQACEKIWCLCFIPSCFKYPDGIILAGSSAGDIYFYDMEAPNNSFKLEAHSDGVSCLTSGVFGVFISGSFDNSAKIWSGTDCYSILDGHNDAVLAVAFLKKDLVLTGSADCTIRLWISDKFERNFFGHSSAVTSLLATSEHQFLSCSSDGSVRLWNLTGECLHIYETNSKIYDIVFLPNKDYVAILCEDRVEILCHLRHFQKLTTPSNPLSITCTERGGIFVGCRDGGLHLFQIPEEFNLLHLPKLLKEHEMEIKHVFDSAEKNRGQVSEMKKMSKKKIAIIGAGIAGLSCASQLKELGFSDVKVFEGKENVGGRIQTRYFGSSYIDLGAQWIHGEDGNSVYELALKEDLVLKEAPDYIDLLYSFKNLQNKIEYLMVRQLIEFLEQKVKNVVDGPYDDSLFSYLAYHFSEYCSNFPDECQDLLTQVFVWFTKSMCELNGCRDLSDVSRSLLHCYENCDGNETIEVKNGCYSIINSILKKIPPEWLAVNHIVEAIDYQEFIPCDKRGESFSKELCDCLNSSRKVKISFKNGETVVCDHLILTVSVGCLKANKIAFYPKLEESKQIAIDKIGFHVVNKIYLEFEDIFWKYPSIFNVLWKASYEEILKKSEPEEFKWKICWPKYINRFAYSHGHPKVLTAWITGEGAEYIEKLSDEEISYGCWKLLELTLCREIPKPCQIIRSSWKSDPFVCGSYSFLTVDNKCWEVDNSDLSEPIFSSHVSCKQHPVIQFAGEATHNYFYSTMHGAYDTGLREANRLNRHYLKY